MDRGAPAGDSAFREDDDGGQVSEGLHSAKQKVPGSKFRTEPTVLLSSLTLKEFFFLMPQRSRE